MYNKQLYTFMKVADSGSFKKAAEELYISNVSVMKQMNSLESHFGFSLFERSNHGITMTPAGYSIYQDAKKIMKESDDAIKRAAKLASANQNTIRIGTSLLRPCKDLINLWNNEMKSTSNFQIKIVPFDDNPISMKSMMDNFGNEIDCFVSPCDSISWQEKYSILQIAHNPCRIALSRNHRLAKKKSLTWNDLSGETFYIIERGDSPVINQIRQEIGTHSDIHMADIKHFYDTSVFNECEQMGYIMESLDIWADVHPSLVTIPMDWSYEMPYGIVYPKNPTNLVKQFVNCIRQLNIEE